MTGIAVESLEGGLAGVQAVGEWHLVDVLETPDAGLLTAFLVGLALWGGSGSALLQET